MTIQIRAIVQVPLVTGNLFPLIPEYRYRIQIVINEIVHDLIISYDPTEMCSTSKRSVEAPEIVLSLMPLNIMPDCMEQIKR